VPRSGHCWVCKSSAGWVPAAGGRAVVGARCQDGFMPSTLPVADFWTAAAATFDTEP
jgi:hypothetical protein